jgi:hypothetical protein
MTDEKTELPPPEPEPDNEALTAAVANLRAVMENARQFHRPPGLRLEEIDLAVKGIEGALKPAADE